MTGLNVLVPDKWGGLAVCDLDQLVDYLAESEPLDEAIGNAAFDTIELGSRSTVERLREHIARVRQLNEDDDFDYWKIRDGS